MPVSEVKTGMKAIAWTVFQGTEPEPVPVEIIGLSKNMWGPKQDIILGKMGGKAARTNVAKGMSGSPVYINGKLIGAVSLGLSQFSPDAICGITPIELMLEINGKDQSRPVDARVPGKAVAANPLAGDGALESLIPIESPLVFSGLNGDTLRDFGGIFQQMGVRTVQGAGGTTTHGSKPVAGWEHSLNPGDSVSTILVDGDMGIAAFGTVTYNDGKRVLAFGHPLFNLGPVDMPLAKSEVVLTLASQFQPSKMANATGVVGALRQDRHSGIMGELGADLADDSRHAEDPLARRKRSSAQRKGFPLQRLRPSEVDAHPDDADPLQLHPESERVRRRSHLPAERQGRNERPAQHRTGHHAGHRRYAHARPDGAGAVARRQIQSPLRQQRESARREGCNDEPRPAARAPRGHHRKRLGREPRSAGRRRSPRQGFAPPVSRRGHPARGQSARFPRDWARATTAFC